MKKIIFLFAVLGIAGCDIFNPGYVEDANNPTVTSVVQNASKAQLQNLVAGLLELNRGSTVSLVDNLGAYGREFFPMYSSDPRNLGDYIGIQPGANAETNHDFRGSGSLWSSHYSVIKQANILIKSVKASSDVTDQQRKGYIGLAQTIKAFHYLIPALTQKHENGIRLDVKDPLNPGPFVSYDKAMQHILDLLDTAQDNLQQAGNSFSFTLTNGLNDFNSPAKFIRLNRALYARVAIYFKKWKPALDALAAAKPFFELGMGKSVMNKGAYFVYTGPPDSFNPYYYKRNAETNQILMVEPHMITDIRPGDQRINKFFKRDDPIVQTVYGVTLSALYQGNRFESDTSPFPWIRNEELILIYAEAKAHLGKFSDADKAINDVRATWGLPSNYDSHNTLSTFVDELLYERRYSLWGEFGQRWIDAKRYDRLDDLPLDHGKIYHYVARPSDEVNWNNLHANQ